MHLYNTSLVRGGSICSALSCNVSSSPQEIVVNHGTWLELLSISNDGEIESLGSSECFAVVRGMALLRPAGSTKDYVVVGSDSGRLALIEFSQSEQRFCRVKCETYGKSGVRRIVPGQYVATDPMGRCVMIGAVEKQKLVFNVARNESNELVTASPLEAHKPSTLLIDLQALFVDLENPLFAAIEMDYTAAPFQRFVAVYEVEEGLNQVVRKAVQLAVEGANKLISVPGGADGPGGFFVCGEGWIEYQRVGQDVAKELPLRVRIPIRVGTPEGRLPLIVASAMNLRKVKGETSLFFLLQTEDGDLFKLDLSTDSESRRLSGFSLKYFDTCPVAKSLCITKRGFLFVAAEFGDHRCYQFKTLGGDDDKTVVAKAGSDQGPVLFAPRAVRNLRLTHSRSSLAPALGLQVAEMFGEERNQITVACGRGSRSSVRILRHGLEVTQIAVTDLGGTPSAIWTVPAAGGNGDQYIVVSFANVTMVLAVTENSVEQATDSQLRADVQTIAIGRLADGSIVQVHPNGMHRTGNSAGWTAPGGKKVDCATLNERQIVIALEGGQLVYFELDESNSLQQQSHDFGSDVRCLDIGELPKGRKRSPFLVLGLFVNSLQILSLDPATMFKQVTTQVLPEQAMSVSLIEMPFDSSSTALNLCAGLRNGVLVRSRLDESSGTILDTKTTFLGRAPVKCFRIKLPADNNVDGQGGVQNALLALSSRPWVSFMYHGRSRLVPLSCQMLMHASNFVSSICDGVVAISGTSMTIFELDDLSQMFNSKSIPLEFTPRKLLFHKTSNTIVVIEGDHNTPAEEELTTAWKQLKELHDQQYPAANEQQGSQDDEDDDQPQLSLEEVGLPRCSSHDSGRWACQIRLIEPTTSRTTMKVPLEPNELAVSACFTQFWPEQEEFLVVGCVTGLKLHPQAHKSCCVKVFRMLPNNMITLVHSTPLEVPGIPRALCSIQGMLAVGIGNLIRIFSLGQKKLLLKAEAKSMPTAVSFLHSNGNRLYAGDAHESVHIFKFSSSSLSLAPFADDSVPRLCVAGEVLDYDTVAGSDKFGNIFVLRLPSDVGDADVENVSGDRMLWDQAKNSGAPNKLDLLCNYYVGELVTSLQKTALVPGKAEALVYSTVSGTIGAMVPFGSKSDLEFFSLLEMQLRAHMSDLVGREHLPFRGYFSPVKGVIDGDLCQLFDALPLDKQAVIAKELDRTPAEVSKKIDDFRTCLL